MLSDEAVIAIDQALDMLGETYFRQGNIDDMYGSVWDTVKGQYWKESQQKLLQLQTNIRR